MSPPIVMQENLTYSPYYSNWVKHPVSNPCQLFIPQKTIQSCIYFEGVGVHTGHRSRIIVHAAPPDHGIVFIRTDLPNTPSIPAHYSYVKKTIFCTEIEKDGANIQTIEHLMAALSAAGITNVSIEIDGPEIPILDGSALPFLTEFRRVGIKKEASSAPIIKINKKIEVSNAYGRASLEPTLDSTLHLEVSIDAVDRFGVNFGKQVCKSTLAKSLDWIQARTFGTYDEGMALKSRGLALGADLTNTIVIKNHAILNPEGLRFLNEMASHKLLDAVGDLSLSGGVLIGLYLGHNSGHALNHALLLALFSDSTAFSLI